jgi:hypothetical protein
MRMIGAQLSGVLDQHDPGVMRYETKKARQHRRLAAAGTAGHQEGQSRFDNRPQPIGTHWIDGSRPHEVIEFEGTLPGHPQGDGRAIHRQRREHRMQSGAVRKSSIDIGHRTVESSSCCRCQALGQPTNFVLVAKARRHPLDALAPVDPDCIRRSDQDIGHPWHPQEGLQRASSHEFPPDVLHEGEDGSIAEDQPFITERLRDPSWRCLRGRGNKPASDAIDKGQAPRPAHATRSLDARRG